MDAGSPSRLERVPMSNFSTSPVPPTWFYHEAEDFVPNEELLLQLIPLLLGDSGRALESVVELLVHCHW